jgi:hypothetical protein
LFLPPDPATAKPPGRARQYGDRLTQDRIDALAAEEHHLRLCGKLKLVRLRSTLAVVRFLKVTLVRAVWYEFFDQKKQCWSEPRLLIATETAPVPTHILQFYALRWGIESLFQNLKRGWGANNHWEQSRRVLELWMQVRSTGYALMHLLALPLPETFPLATIAPWRPHQSIITAGLSGHVLDHQRNRAVVLSRGIALSMDGKGSWRDKACVSHYTSSRRSETTSGWRRRQDSLTAIAFLGGLLPRGSYRHSFLSL